MRNDIPAALFLLPFLVADILERAPPRVSDAIRSEVLAVLNAAPTGKGTVRPEYRRGATQAIFSLLDTLTRWDSCAEAHRFVESIPQEVLAQAALSCGAHARALRHLESALRTENLGKTEQGLLVLPRRNLIVLQKVYSQLDEPDGLAGINALRAVCAGDASSWQERLQERIIDCEHEGRWSEALACYEQAMAALESSSDDLAEWDEPSVQTGILRCLQNAGHLETALRRGVSVLSQRSDMAADVLPNVVESAWRLGRWEALDELLPTNESGSTRGPAVNAAAMETYGTLLGAAVSELNHSPGNLVSFRLAMDRVRVKAMAGFSAASVESYSRSVAVCMFVVLVAAW